MKITTMTICCKLDVVFNCENIARYIELSKKDILQISYGYASNEDTNRSILPKKNFSKNKKKKRQKKAFFNQVSMYVYSKYKDKHKPVNLKIFSNGAFQMTGIQKLEIIFDVIEKITRKLSETKAIINKKKLRVDEKPFSENPLAVDLNKFEIFTIGMINAKFHFPMKLNRTALYVILNRDKYTVKFDLAKHAGVRIKYDYGGTRKLTIIVFEEGSIIVAGADNCEQLRKGYEWINKYLLKNINNVVKKTINIKYDKWKDTIQK